MQISKEYVLGLIKTRRATLYRKTGVVQATLVEEGEVITTTLRNGLVETTNKGRAGDYLVTGSGGEKYIVPQRDFIENYSLMDGTSDRYVPSRVIWAIQNPTGQPIKILAPWGQWQFGDESCWLVADANDLLVYLIGDEEFKATYKEVE